MYKMGRFSQFITGAVFIALVLFMNSDAPDIWLIVLAAIMEVNVVLSFFHMTKKEEVIKG